MTAPRLAENSTETSPDEGPCITPGCERVARRSGRCWGCSKAAWRKEKAEGSRSSAWLALTEAAFGFADAKTDATADMEFLTTITDGLQRAALQYAASVWGQTGDNGVDNSGGEENSTSSENLRLRRQS